MRTIRIKIKAHVPIIGGCQGKVLSCDRVGECIARLFNAEGQCIGHWPVHLDDIDLQIAI